jgi:hypothetical protein
MLRQHVPAAGPKPFGHDLVAMAERIEATPFDELDALADELVTQHDARIGWLGCAYRCRLWGIQSSSTANTRFAMRAWAIAARRKSQQRSLNR